MSSVEWNRIDTSDRNAKPETPISQGGSLIIEFFLPATLHVFCDVFDKGGQILFNGEVRHLLIALQKGDGTPKPVKNFSEGMSFGKRETVFIGTKDSDKVLSFNYEPSTQNQVLMRFERDVLK